MFNMEETRKTSKILIMVFWLVILCSDVEGYKCFRGPCCLHLQGEMNGIERRINIGRVYMR